MLRSNFNPSLHTWKGTCGAPCARIVRYHVSWSVPCVCCGRCGLTASPTHTPAGVQEQDQLSPKLKALLVEYFQRLEPASNITAMVWGRVRVSHHTLMQLPYICCTDAYPLSRHLHFVAGEHGRTSDGPASVAAYAASTREGRDPSAHAQVSLQEV